MHHTRATVRKILPARGIAFVRPDHVPSGVDAIMHLTKAPDVAVGDRLDVTLRVRPKGLSVRSVLGSVARDPVRALA